MWAEDHLPGAGVWDVVVVGGGPAGLAAAHAAATAGARTLVLERARHPRYKTCGGGLIGTSLSSLPAGTAVPVRDQVRTVTFTFDGRRRTTRQEDGPVLVMVNRAEFDQALCRAATGAGAVVAERRTVRALAGEGDRVRISLTGGGEVTSRVVVGADGSAGVTARHVGVRFEQVDLGLELEIPVPEPVRERWAGRLLIDWGPLPGSYGWVFPKGDTLTVGVIASRGLGERTRGYLRAFVDRLGLSTFEPRHDSGHLTRCRTPDSPLRRGRVLVAGDAAGLLEPWTREGISFALRSGCLAGAAAARAARLDGAGTHPPGAGGTGTRPPAAGGTGGASGTPAADLLAALDGYAGDIEAGLGVEMAAGRRLFAAYRRHPAAFHAALSTPPGWRVFADFCRGDRDLAAVSASRRVRATLAALNRW